MQLDWGKKQRKDQRKLREERRKIGRSKEGEKKGKMNFLGNQQRIKLSRNKILKIKRRVAGDPNDVTTLVIE